MTVDDLLTAIAAPTPDWHHQAACRGINPDLFFPTAGRNTANNALETCHSCPVRTECLDAHLYENHGIFGGTTERDRIKLRRNTRQTGPVLTPKVRANAAECGTKAGYERHRRESKPACELCLNAYKEWRRDQRNSAA